MPLFEYQQRDRSGKLYKGQLEASSIRDASSRLRDEGMFLIALKPVGDAKTASEGFKIGGKSVKLRDLLMFTKQFAVMIRAGVNLNNCLNLLAQQTENNYFSGIILQIRRDIEGGESLHVSLTKHPKIFPMIYIHMIEAGEASGQLDTILERLTEHLEREFELKKKITSAMTYPSVIMVVAIAAVFILMIFVVPQFVEMFKGFNMELPFITKALVAVSSFCQNFWYVIIIAIVILVIGFQRYHATPQGKKNIDHFLYKLKIIGPVIQKLAAARFARTLGTLLNSGVQITTSLEIVERAVGNMVIAEAVNLARINITRGTMISTPLAQTKVFPPLVTQLIAVGEETGEMAAMLTQIADFYEKEAGYAVEGLTNLIEPMIIVFVGGIIGVIVAAIYIPIFNMMSIANQH